MLMGYFERGNIKLTTGQSKKHIQQMNQEEVNRIVNKLKYIGKLNISKHLKEKKIIINNLTIQSNLKSKNLKNMIVEYNNTYGHNRVLIRSDVVELVLIGGSYKQCNLCYVIDLDNSVIITAYYNELKDNHRNINWSRYNENLIISI